MKDPFSVLERLRERKKIPKFNEEYVLEEICLIAEEFLENLIDANINKSGFEEELYHNARKRLTDIDVNQRDLDWLVSHIGGEVQMENRDYSGLLISAVANRLFDKTDEVKIDIAGYEPIGFLGYLHKRGTLTITGNSGFLTGTKMHGGRIIVNGDCKPGAGKYMSGGELKIFGNAGDLCDDMRGGKAELFGDCQGSVGSRNSGGEIYVKGNAEDWVGNSMKKGKITVTGNCGDYVGYNMDGGEIHIGGDAGNSLGTCQEGGKIYVTGSCGKSACASRQGGEIYVKGDCGQGLGNWMFGGTVSIDGNLGEFDTDMVHGGKIVHKGKTILDKKEGAQ